MADFEGIIRKHAGEDGTIPAAAVGKLAQAIANAVGHDFVEKKRYNEKLEEIDALRGEKQNAEDSATTAQKWKDKYDALKSEFETYKTDAAEKEAAAQKAALYRAALKAAGVDEKRFDAILRVTDLSGIAVKDGKLEDEKGVIDAIKADYSDFIPTTTTTGTRVENPPVNTGAGMTRAQILGIRDATARQQAIAANIDQFK